MATSITTTSAPIISAISPPSGVQGQTVAIGGSGFSGTTGVKFGTVPASSFVIVSDSYLTAMAPAGTGSVDITVTTAGGTSVPDAASVFSYTASVAAETAAISSDQTAITAADATIQAALTKLAQDVDALAKAVASAPASTGSSTTTVDTVGALTALGTASSSLTSASSAVAAATKALTPTS